MKLACTIYYLTICLSLVLTILAGISGDPVAIFSALLILALTIFKTSATRIIIGVLYGLSSIYIFLFTGIVVSGVTGARTTVILLFTGCALLALLSTTYFVYKPLKQLLKRTEA